MSPTRIRTIKKINNYRIFQGWKPSGSVEFGRVNLIYGQNGSGKSTLASLLQGCAYRNSDGSAGLAGSDDEIAGAGLRIHVCDSSSSSDSKDLEIGLDDREFWGRVKVFNRDFVRRNLRFEEASGPQPEALLIVGTQLADARKELEELRPMLAKSRENVSRLEEEIKSARNNVDKHLRVVARQVVDDLRASPISRYRATNAYTIRQVRELLEDDASVLADVSTDLAADRRLAVSSAMEPVRLLRRDTLLERDGVAEAQRLLETSVVTNERIDELVVDADRSNWVQDGISLHKGLEECLFCGQKLTRARLDALNAHFDESFKAIQSKIDDLVERLNGCVKASKAYFDALPSDSDVYDDLKEDLQNAREAYAIEHQAYAEVVGIIITALREKRANPFSAPELSSNLALAAPNMTALDRVSKAHQARIDGHEAEVRKAAERVEYYHVKNSADEYARLTKEVGAKESDRDELQGRVSDLKDQIATLENVDGDPVPAAGELTGYVARLLGRDELTFSATPDGKHYVIERSGVPASNLSEGEQTAIALLYFLTSVREDKISGDPPIVIIDDPVSSLDNEILFGASAHIWSDLVECEYAAQVFLMTHNFELFRHWLIQLESRNQREGCDYKAYSMTPRYVKRGADLYPRTSELKCWETDQNRSRVLRSEYHYLFSRVAHSVVDRRGDENPADQMNELALIPNAARRMLEAFLSFRCPGRVGSFHVAMKELMVQADLREGDVSARVEKYLHTYSHFDGGNVSQGLSLTEATTVLRSLFVLMDRVDHAHVASMCEALGVNEHELLGKSAFLEGGAV